MFSAWAWPSVKWRTAASGCPGRTRHTVQFMLKRRFTAFRVDGQHSPLVEQRVVLGSPFGSFILERVFGPLDPPFSKAGKLKGT